MSDHASLPQAGNSASPPVFDRTSKLVALLIGGAAVIAGALVAILNPWWGAASAEGRAIDTLFNLALGIGTAVFIIVQGFLVYSIVRFAGQPDDETDGMYFRGNTPLEIVWTAVPAIVVLILSVLSYQTLNAIEGPVPGEMTVEVIGYQYGWEFYYPEQDVTSNELHIPLNRTVFLKLRSRDVNHAFWVPEFRIKKDLMGDRWTTARITGTEIGTYPVVCAELCGAGHAAMRSQVIVESDGNFQQWIGARQAAASAPAEAATVDPVAVGRQAFSAKCGACHVLDDANAVGKMGPSLNGIGSRAESEEWLRTSIVKPNDEIAEGYPANVMPKDYEQQLSEAELDALVQYLMAQK